VLLASLRCLLRSPPRGPRPFNPPGPHHRTAPRGWSAEPTTYNVAAPPPRTLPSRLPRGSRDAVGVSCHDERRRDAPSFEPLPLVARSSLAYWLDRLTCSRFTSFTVRIETLAPLESRSRRRASAPQPVEHMNPGGLKGRTSRGGCEAPPAPRLETAKPSPGRHVIGGRRSRPPRWRFV